jgi:hypothetical protein
MVVVQSPRCPRMIARRLLLLLLFSFAGLSALADSGPALRATVNELAPRTRRAAPEWVEVLLHSKSTAIREGALEFTMIEWGDVVYRYRTHDLAINSGDQRFRFMLPAASQSGVNSDRTLELRFLEKGRTTMLGGFPLNASQRNGVAHVIAVIRPAFRAPGGGTNPIWQALRLERFAPEEGPNFDTTPIFFDPADVPADPLGFFPFDLVLIESDALGKMRERARAALFQWVNAGGSVCIMADRSLEPEHAEAINQLASGDPRWKPLLVAGPGEVQTPEKMALARVNFGRLAVASELPPENVETISPLWQKAAAFLWKLTSAQAQQIEQTGKWDPQLGRSPSILKLSQEEQKKLQRERSQRYLLNSNWRRFDTPVWEVFPNSVRVVPLWVLAGLAGLFIVLIGPVDWFGLGALRRHRLTWVFFPLVAVMVTAGTVMLAQRYMGTARRAGTVIIRDIGVTGRVIRETRIELELPVAQKIATTSVRGALRLPFKASSQSRRGGGSAWDGTIYHGQYPARFDYTRPQRQWSPEISRVTSVPDAEDISGVNWDVFASDMLSKHKSAFYPLEMGSSSKTVEAPEFDQAVENAVGRDRERKVALSVFTEWGTRDIGDFPAHVDWRRAITTSPPGAGFTLITHVSPNGFPQNDDLRILEPGDPSRTVVVATEREGDIIHVWRRLFLHK